jgi:hypothetical protein
MNDYEAARQQYEQAERNLPLAKAEAAQLVRSAEDELFAAVRNLRRFELAPGVPKPQFLTGAAA